MEYPSENREISRSKSVTSGRPFWYLAKSYDARHFTIARETESSDLSAFQTILDALDTQDIRLTLVYKRHNDYEQEIAVRLLQVSVRSIELLQLAAPYVTHLDLSQLRLSTLQPQWLVGLSWRLKTLILERNRLDLHAFNVFDEIIGVQNRTSTSGNRSSRNTNRTSWFNSLCELRLDWNQMDGALPASTLAKLTELTRLSFAHNALNTLRGVDALTNLRVLNLDYNRIATLPVDLFNLKRLEYLYVSNNQLLQPILGVGFRRLTHLRVIDLSHNALSTLPAALFTLPQLDHLCASHNTLITLPIIQSIAHRGSRRILTIDLAYNRLTTVSTSLARLTHQLDLSHNRIRNLPPSLLKWIANTMQHRGLRASQVIQLDLTDNPLKWPPPATVSDGTETLMEFYHESKTEVQTYHGLRAMLVGAPRCGKSSLIVSMLDGQCRFTDEREERTYGVDTFDVPFDASDLADHSTLSGEIKSVGVKEDGMMDSANSSTSDPVNRQTNLNIWDCSGQTCYQPLIHFIAYQPVILAIAVDMSVYLGPQFDVPTDELSPNFQTAIGQWIEMALIRSNHVTVILLGTKYDLIPGQIRLEQVLRKILQDTKAFLAERSYWFQEELRRIEALPNISPSMAHHYEQLNRIQKTARVLIYATVLPTSSATDPDNSNHMWHDFCAGLIKATLQTPDTLPYLLAPIPSAWADVESYLEGWHSSSTTNRTGAQPNDADYLFYERQAFALRMQTKFNVDATNMNVLVRYLCDTGQVLAPYLTRSKEEAEWWNALSLTGARPEPTALICLRPNLLLDCMKFMLNPQLYLMLDANKSIGSLDVPPAPSFVPRLLRHFQAATSEGAARRLRECAECVSLWGILPADLWLALAEYNHLGCTGLNSSTAKNFVEFVWRWLDLAYPIPDPTVAVEQTNLEADQEKNETEATLFEPPETPLNLALAAGLYMAEPSISKSDENPGEYSPADRATPSPTFSGIFTLPALRFPSLIMQPDVDPDGCAAMLWRRASEHGPAPIRPVYRFPRGMPAGLFKRATVRLNWPEELKFHYMEQWKNGVQMCHTSQQLLVRFTVDQPIDADPSLRFEFRGLIKQSEETKPASVTQSDAPSRSDPSDSAEHSKRERKRAERPRWHGWPVPEEVLWDWIVPMLKTLDGLLLAYQGLCYKRLMQCPKCDEVTFTGEWLFPQEMQMVRWKKCVACVYKVSTCLLAPPERGLEALRLQQARRRRKKYEKSKLKARQMERRHEDPN